MLNVILKLKEKRFVDSFSLTVKYTKVCYEIPTKFNLYMYLIIR